MWYKGRLFNLTIVQEEDEMTDQVTVGGAPRKRSLAELAFIPLLVGLAVSIVFQWGRYYKTVEKHTYYNTTGGLLELQIERERNAQSAAKDNPPPTVKTTQVIDKFFCPTIEARDSGFMTAGVQYLEKGNTTFVIPQGCAAVSLKGQALHSLSRLQAAGPYLFRQGNMGCGTMEGLNDPPSKCLDYLREKRGQVVEVITTGQIIID